MTTTTAGPQVVTDRSSRKPGTAPREYRPRSPQPYRRGAAIPPPPLLRSYFGYVAYFLGTGLISGGVVHYPLNPGYNAIAMAVGVLIFMSASLYNEFIGTGKRPHVFSVFRTVGIALMLSFGIGMMSGGIMHFYDFPTRAAMLFPIGVLLSFTAYVLNRANDDMIGVAISGFVVVIFAVVAFLGMYQLATALEARGTGGHSHGPSATDDHHGARAPVAPAEPKGEKAEKAEKVAPVAQEPAPAPAPKAPVAKAPASDHDAVPHGH